MRTDGHRARGRLDEAQHQPSHGRLARPRLPHQPEGLPGRDREVDAVDRAHHTDLPSQQGTADREVLAQPDDLHERRRVERRATGRRREHLVMRAAQVELVGADAADATVAPRGPRHRRCGARVLDMRAAVGEPAADGPRVGARDLSRDDGERFTGRRALRHRREQPGRVRVSRPLEHRVERGLLHHLTRVHHHDAVADVGDHAEVVGDEHDRHARVALQGAEQVEDLRLDRDVERSGRLVGDEQLRVVCERHRDHRPLPHPTRERVRVVLDTALRVRDADTVEHLHGARGGLGPAHLLVGAHRLRDLVADRERRVQARHRLLEDHRHLRAAERSPLGPADGGEVVLAEAEHARPHSPGALRDQAHHRERRHALPTSALAHEAEGLPPVHGEAHAVDDPECAATRAELDAEVDDLEERRVAHDRRHGPSTAIRSRPSESRSPSPTRLNARIARRIATAGGMSGHWVSNIWL